VTEAVCDNADAMRLASSFARATWSDAASWGYLLGRLPTAASKDWQRTFAAELDAPALRSLAEKATAVYLAHLSALTMGVMAFNHDLAIDLVDLAIPVIAPALNTTPVETFRRIQDMVWFVLGYMPAFLRPRNPIVHQRSVARHLARLCDTAIAQAIPRGHRRDWEIISRLLGFLHEVMPRQKRKIVAAVDFAALDRATEGMWSTLPSEVVSLIRVLVADSDYEPARSWVNTHAADIGRLDLFVTIVAPEATAYGLRAGLSLELNNGSPGFPITNWDFATFALARLAGVDENVALAVADDNYRLIASSLSNLQATICKGVPDFVALLRDSAPATLAKVVQAIDPVLAERTWAELWRGTSMQRQAVTALCAVAASASGPLSSSAARLTARRCRA